jgi:GTPase involved in cell partitioning and DNA repair
MKFTFITNLITSIAGGKGKSALADAAIKTAREEVSTFALTTLIPVFVTVAMISAIVGFILGFIVGYML